MKNRFVLFLNILVVMLMVAGAQILRADRLELKDGKHIEGTIKKVEMGQVSVDINGEIKSFDILGVSKMEFDMPSLETGTARLPVEHFLAGMEAKEMADHVQAVEDAAAEVQKVIDETRKEWMGRKSVEPGQVNEWNAAKERLASPLAKYQEAVNELYFHALGKVDEYNRLTKDANEIYVGIKGWFNVGSPLVSKNMEKLPLKKYVPSNWYDSIFYEGYNRGYNEAYEKYSVNFHLPYEPPASMSEATKAGE